MGIFSIFVPQIREMVKVSTSLFLVLFAITVCSNLLIANEEHAVADTISPKKFNTGNLIFDHIRDSYEWHITTIGKTHISIPLPVILYSQQSGFHVFMSSKFHHGTEPYDGFKIASEGKNERKIVEVMADGTELQPWDLSISKNVVSLFISIIIIMVIFISVAKKYYKNADKAPKGLQSWIEPLVIFIRDDIARPSIGTMKYEKYLPFLLTIFFFIFVNNLMGLVPFFPGGANLTGNITVTIVLALFTFVITSLSGSRDYWVHLVNAPGVPLWLKLPLPLMPIVEIMGIFIKPFVLTIRLFANITAGHIVALGFYSLIFIFAEKSSVAGYGISIISITFTVFMGILELLVAFIQAYVFTLLSALYIGLALEKHQSHA
jgi:F-type H+-transporting ATPase subunit a